MPNWTQISSPQGPLWLCNCQRGQSYSMLGCRTSNTHQRISNTSQQFPEMLQKLGEPIPFPEQTDFPGGLRVQPKSSEVIELLWLNALLPISLDSGKQLGAD